MSQSTQRPRYFDGEFLRSGDFTDEQSYHIAMRRLLNHELHLSGIVTGLHIVQDANSVPGTTALFYSVAPGFAIDQIGREIYVSAPYSLTPLLSTPGLTNGWYELWIVYTETQSGSPASGYQLCNQQSQNTRWTESFNVVLRFTGAPPDPNVPDPSYDLKGICLGVLDVKYDPTNGWSFYAPPDWYRRRTYAKIRAQSIIAPDQVSIGSFVFGGTPQPSVPPFDGYIHMDTRNGVYSRGNMLIENNALIGSDFALYNDGSPANAALPSGGPSAFSSSGSLKVASDLYVQGNIYEQINHKWTKLDSHAQTLIPDIVLVKPQGFANSFGTSSTTPSTQQLTVTANSNIPSLPPTTQVDAQWVISSYSFVSGADINAWLASGSTVPQPPGITVKFVGAGPTFLPPKSVTFTVQCTVDGGYQSGGIYHFLIDSVELAFVVVFRPA